MPKESKPRAGSLQFWPRKRIKRFIPSVNWGAIKADSGLMGLIAYKVGMTSAVIKDLTPNSLTKEKKITLPATILEVPAMKIFSVRYYKQGKVINEVLAENLDKELNRKIKMPGKKEEKKIEDYDDLRLIVYSKVKETGIKKTPDLAEAALGGSLEEKMKFIEEKKNKDILASDMLKNISLLDVRGLTKGKGFSGPVKRFGIKLKQHKSEKGRRRPGSLAPWHPARVTFRAPMAGQLGVFTRLSYNSRILGLGKINEKDINPGEGWKNYGKIKTEYLILKGSLQGPAKRALLLTMPLRPSKKQMKKNYEFLGVR